MPLVRAQTFDTGIWTTIQREYPTLPESFEWTETVLDIGCHIGALCSLAARRGATVFGYEANRENYALAVLNVRQLPSVTLRNAAVWRSDVPAERLTFTPSADHANTGGGSVLFATAEAHRAARPRENGEEPPLEMSPSAHEVDSVALDEILRELGPVRFLKLDVEGAEFPILLTARRLDLVLALAVEYHELSDDGMELLAPEARVGNRRYSAELLHERLAEAGFDEIRRAPGINGRGHLRARRNPGAPAHQ